MEFIFTGGVGNWIDVTLQYSNAVMVAIMPVANDFARKLDLPVPQPIEAKHVQRGFIHPHERSKIGEIILRDGSVIAVEEGHVSAYLGTNVFWNLQDPHKIPRFYGSVNMTTNEMITSTLLKQWTRRSASVKLLARNE